MRFIRCCIAFQCLHVDNDHIPAIQRSMWHETLPSAPADGIELTPHHVP
jgi:hypothetical protein